MIRAVILHQQQGWLESGELLVPHAAKVYLDQDVLSRGCEVFAGPTDDSFYVETIGSTKQHQRFLISLDDESVANGTVHQPNCKDWIMTDIPCRHVTAAAAAAGLLKDKLAFLHKFMHPCFFVENAYNALTRKWDPAAGACTGERLSNLDAVPLPMPPSLQIARQLDRLETGATPDQKENQRCLLQRPQQRRGQRRGRRDHGHRVIRHGWLGRRCAVRHA